MHRPLIGLVLRKQYVIHPIAQLTTFLCQAFPRPDYKNPGDLARQLASCLKQARGVSALQKAGQPSFSVFWLQSTILIRFRISEQFTPYAQPTFNPVRLAEHYVLRCKHGLRCAKVPPSGPA